MSAQQPYAEHLAPGVSAYIQPDGGWCLNNAGWVTDGESTLLVDTAATERRARDLREALLADGAPPPSHVVNTHHHGDHTYGNAVFTPEAEIVAHERCRAEVLANGHQLHLLWPQTDFGRIAITPASLTYSRRMTLHTAGCEVELIHPGVAHTTGDSIVWLPRQRIVFTGDLIFEGGTPFLPMGSLSGSLRSLDVLRKLGAETVVPGHGPVTDPSAYDRAERYFRFLAETAQDAYAAGRTPLEAARSVDLGEFGAWPESERFVANLHRAYDELAGRPEGSPLDAATVFGDMAIMNGGQMVTCHA
ncbi:MBL fold metallo-hydrolase [Streptomyces sp. NPDC050418]|uniref:MBL fold metallo-hydrolase n=1 Tax=Streptomyces sp. NPDC050418 TaxID=3365612 RepID=UPI0037AB3556